MPFRFLIFGSIFLFSLSGLVSGFSQTTDQPGYHNVQICHDLYAQAVKAFSHNFDSTLLILNEAIPCYKSFNDWENYIKCLNGITSVYFYQNEFEKFKNATFHTYEETRRHFDSTHPEYANAVNNMSSYYFKIGDYDKAIELIFESLRVKEKIKEPKIERAISYLNLANYYKFNGDQDKALEFMDKALEFTLDSLDENHHRIAEIYDGLALIYQQTGQIDSALVYHNASLSILEKLLSTQRNRVYNLTIESIHWLAALWIEKEDVQKGRYYIQKALSLQKEANAYRKFDTYELLSRVLVKEKKYEEALGALETAESIATDHSRRNTPPFIARRYAGFAEIYVLLGDHEKALTFYQDALKILSPGFAGNAFNENPSADDILDQQDALAILGGKAGLLQALYLRSGDLAYLNAAYDTYLTATRLIRNIRQGILTIDSKNALAERTVSLYEGAIRSALELFDRTEDQKYRYTAFLLAENNKALLLLESINEQSAKGFAGIPDSLLDKEKEIKLNLAYLQKTLLEGKNNEELVKKMEDQIFEQRQQLDRLTGDFEKNYPRYFEIKYQNEPIDPKIIQQKLAYSNNALLEYFVGEEAIYLFILTPERLDVQVIGEGITVFEAIGRLRGILNHPPGEDAQSGFARFTSTAHILYSVLLESALQSLPEDIAGLTIIPDYQLNYLPFEILLTKAADPGRPGYALSDLDYLLEKYSVSYHYSATLLYKSQQRQKPVYEYDFIGFAPTFEETNTVASRACTMDELYSLQCSSEEVHSISELLNGTARVGGQALKTVFEEEAPAYRILHMATHACIDENNANLNKIFLTDDFLSNFDLYNMELSAELAVLSACNTGSGELVKGEGVMSLARGFINAGCSSTLMSMWSVDDCATSDIMFRFYKGIKDGLKKDEALRSAKLDYLSAVSKTKMHPYYWAAFVQYGDVSVITFNTALKWSYWLAGAVLFFVSVFFIMRKFY